MKKYEFVINNLQKYHLDNGLIYKRTACLKNNDTGKSLEVELMKDSQGEVVALCKNNILYTLIAPNKPIEDFAEGDIVEIGVPIPQNDLSY